MALAWIREEPPLWDDHKARLIGDAPANSFLQPLSYKKGARLPGEWWRVEDGGQVVGFGWMDNVAGEAEVLLVSSPKARGQGVGTFIMNQLQAVAQKQGINSIYNTVHPKHPDGKKLTTWLQKLGFEAAEDGSLRRTVKKR